MPEEKSVEPRVLRGFRDYLPAQMNARLHLISMIRAVYERYGFQPLDTPALEHRLTLMGYGEENTKQIFEFLNPEEEQVALRFDLTVPLARVVAQYPDLPLPFRRYQVAPVWRADKPDPGRFREFTQFDIDAVGVTTLAADVEIISATHDVFRALGIERFRVRFSSRKVLDSLLDFSGIPRSSAYGVFRVMDKLDKIGLEGVVAELTSGRIDVSGDTIKGLGLATDRVDRIREFVAMPHGARKDVLAALADLFKAVPSAAEALDDLGFICAALDALGIADERAALDLSIARGLDYYTGSVFEAVLLDAPEFGSVFGGGRYDGLVERFLGKKIPGVGGSIGVDRLLAALQKLGLAGTGAATAQVLVTVMEPGRMVDYMMVTREIREAGINAELYMGTERGLRKQLQYADRLQIPVGVILGSNEFSGGTVTVKNLRVGTQLQEKKGSAPGVERKDWLDRQRAVQNTVPRAGLVDEIRSMLG
jgi:histidyl-tRNA synthetase